MKFQVEFTINRIPIRLQQRAVELAVQHKLKEVLFPTESNVSVPTPQLRSVSAQKDNEALLEFVETALTLAVCNAYCSDSMNPHYVGLVD